MTNNRKRDYTAEFKWDAIRLALRSSSIKKTADNLGIPEATLSTWIRNTSIKQYKSDNHDSSIDLAAELKKFSKENARLREEQEILKKAAAFFAKEYK